MFLLLISAFSIAAVSYTHLDVYKRQAYGGVNAPYIWLKCPDGLKSWDLFDLLINRVYVVGTPGQGFGEHGEGFFRLTAFGTRENTVKAVERIKSLF